MRFLLALIFLIQLPSFSQTLNHTISKSNHPNSAKSSHLQFSSPNSFIENIGQYGELLDGFNNMGKIKYGFEGFSTPVLFTNKGIIYLDRKVENISEREEKKMKLRGISEEEIESKKKITESIITMEWLGANIQGEIITEGVTTDYHTYGLLKNKARGFEKITYRDLYPGIDVVYHFTNSSKIGFEYSLVVKSGADLSLVRMKYGGDIKKLFLDKSGNLIVRSSINDIIETRPVSFSDFRKEPLLSGDEQEQNLSYASIFQKENNIISFRVTDYDTSKTLIIDPFVSNTNNLTGANNGIAKDIDFDYAGNIYVTGGGDGITAHKIAKFDINGNLQWTFNGTLAVPAWAFGTTYGGWVVEKTTGNIFLGQGLAPSGSQIIRLTTSGVYDNYITTADLNFSENWKMLWSCNSGTPQILVAGGGTSSNINLGVCSPPSTTLIASNITGLTTFGQDIADIVIDPSTNDMYTIFTSAIITPFVNNRIYKNSPPYGPSNITWSVPSGFPVLNEQRNRPYLSPNTFGYTENSLNALAINSSYLFYWDGLNLAAYNKSTGAVVGSPLVLNPNTTLMQGGIVADECNNIYVGNRNGIIKVYKFNGSNFDDAAANDITISGVPTASVYDLAYDQGRQLLYACGAGFIASIDISAYCATTVFSLVVVPNCNALTIQASITPVAPPGTIVTYVLYSGAVQIASNSTGLFTGLTPGATYIVKAYIDQSCGGIQLIKTVTLSNCALSISATFINPSCNLSNGSITATAFYGTPPYQYSKDGITYQPTGLFSGLAAGNYTITVRDAINTTATVNVTLANSSPLQVSAIPTSATCNLNNGTIIANGIGGTMPLQYSSDGINFQPTGLFTGLAPNSYTITVKDANSCSNTTVAFVTTIPAPQITADSIPTSCNNSSGMITATATSGSPPYQFSINGTTFQASNIFTGLATGAYTVTVKDAIGCIATRSISVIVTNTLVVNAGNNMTICEGTKKTFSASSNGTSFSWSPVTSLNNPSILNPDASPLVTTLYTLTGRDGICFKTSSVTVFVNPAPVADAGKDVGVCYGKNVQLTGGGGVDYLWTPSTYLTNSNIYNPIVVKPVPGKYTYYLSVTGANGCKSLKPDAVTINVSTPPKLFAGNDTSIAINQPLQLNAVDVNASGFINYSWSPAYGLNNPSLANPIAILDQDILYNVSAQNANGCIGTDDIKVTVHKGPEIYVPTAFSPSGKNKILKAIPVGMREFKYFSIFNSYGQQIFTTSDPNRGWDGTFKGANQEMGTYVWIAEGVDFKENKLLRKGCVILIR